MKKHTQKGYMQITFAIAFTLPLLFSCNMETEKHKGSLEYSFDFAEEILRLEKENPVVSKSVTRNGKTETILDTIQWGIELSFFVKADINRPRFMDSYQMEISEIEGIKTVIYKAGSDDLPVRFVKYIYSGNELNEIFILYEVNNLITKSNYELSYFPYRKYIINGSQSVPFFYEENFIVEGNFSKWRGALQIENGSSKEEIPFQFYFIKSTTENVVEILNAEEKIVCDEVSLINDSIFIRIPVFDSEIKGKFISDTRITGAWNNYSKGSDYIVPFYAEFGTFPRFRFNDDPDSIPDISGKWSTEFAPGQSDQYSAIGIFKQKGSVVSGTFLTETGDYRYLEGTARNNELYLSGFNGAHAFLFKAVVKEGNILEGNFFSGKHWTKPFIAHKNPDAMLSDPDSLTFLKAGYDKLAFSFPDPDSTIISLSDKSFQNKVVIVQISGSWCPNCLDETIYFSDLYKRKHEKGLEIIGLSFERGHEFSKARQAVKRFKDQLNAPYNFLIAGTASVAKANEALPMLDKVMSFPTSIFLDKQGKVRKIHTGFYGPGTGDYFQKYKEDTEEFLEKLLEE